MCTFFLALSKTKRNPFFELGGNSIDLTLSFLVLQHHGVSPRLLYVLRSIPLPPISIFPVKETPKENERKIDPPSKSRSSI